MNTCVERSVKNTSTEFSLARLRAFFNWNGCDWSSFTSCFVIVQKQWLIDAPRKLHKCPTCYLQDNVSLGSNESREPLFQMPYKPLIQQGSWENYSSVPYWAAAQLLMERKKWVMMKVPVEVNLSWAMNTMAQRGKRWQSEHQHKSQWL